MTAHWPEWLASCVNESMVERAFVVGCEWSGTLVGVASVVVVGGIG